MFPILSESSKRFFKTYWRFLLFFSVMMGVGFYYLAYGEGRWSYPQIFTDTILQFLIGCLVGFAIGFALAYVYDWYGEESFSKAKILYAGTVLSVSFIVPVAYVPEMLSTVLVTLFFVTTGLVVFFLVRRFYKTPDLLLLHFAGLFLWWFFLLLYWINIQGYYFPH